MLATAEPRGGIQLRLAFAIAAGLLLTAVVTHAPWFADEALQQIRSALNLAHYADPVFNVGQASAVGAQSPWVWLLGVEYLLGAPVLSAAIASEVCLVIGAIILLGRVAWLSSSPERTALESSRDLAKWIAVAAFLASSITFRANLAAGLEYSLVLFLASLLGALLAAPNFELARFSRGKSFASAFVSSLLVLTRPELAAAVATLAVIICWRRHRHIARHIAPILVGSSPLLLWFGCCQFGGACLAGNSAWSRLMGKLAWNDIFRHGSLYLVDCALREPMSLILIGAGVASGLWSVRAPFRGPLPLLFSLGSLSSVALIVAMGGGDQSGRLFCGPLCMSAVALAASRPIPIRALLFFGAYIAVFFDRGKVLSSMDGRPPVPRTVELFRQWGISDEYLQRQSRTLAVFGPEGRQAPSLWRSTAKRAASGRFIISDEPGLDGLRLGPAVAVFDRRLIADPRSIVPGILTVDRRWSAVNSPEPAGSIAASIRFKERAAGTIEPILVAGQHGDRVGVSIEHHKGGAVRFRIRKGDAVYFSPIVRTLEYGVAHELLVEYGQATTGLSAPTLFQLALDRVRLREIPLDLPRYSVGEVTMGWNLGSEPGCEDRFSGSIERVKSAGPDAFARARWLTVVPDGAELSFNVRFSSSAAAEPLVSTGKEGFSDIIMAKHMGPSSIMIGLVHGVLMPLTGPTIAVDDQAFHRLVIRLGPLFLKDPGIFPSDRVSVQIDGKTALLLQQPIFPFEPHEIYPLDNPFANAYCGRDFTGQIGAISVRESPFSGSAVRKLLRNGHGAITMVVQFDGTTITRGMGLVETGHSGAGDALSVTRTDSNHVQFAFDHWSYGGPVGPVVAVDASTTHVLTIDMDSLHAGDGSVPKGLVRVTLDGAVALEGHSPCYPCKPEEIFLLQNALHSSGIAVPFDCTCLSVSRSP
jgi:hypothetical protein